MNVVNEQGAVIEMVGGYPVKQHFNEKIGRWYVWLPKHCGLRELWNKRDRVSRSHYVYMRKTGSIVPKTHVIHHIDHDRSNDRYENLKLMTHADHNEYHEKHLIEYPKISSFTGRKHSEETKLKMSENAQQRGNNDIWGGEKKKHFDSTRELMSDKSSGSKNAMYRHDLNTEAVKRAYQRLGNLGQVARIFGCSVQAVRFRVTENTENEIDWKTLSDEEILSALENNDGNLHRTTLILNAPATSLWRRIKRIKEKANAGIC